MNGVIVVNKPDNVNSQQVVSRIKYKFNKQYKVGHYGTLDPKATGVLPIAVGKATKLFNFFQDKIKVYRAIFRFGVETDTLDSEGELINQGGYLPKIEEVKNALTSFMGDIKQTPPLYSANKINGKRAYELARNNVEFETKVKDVTVYRFELLRQFNDSDYLFEIECSSGTYIRSLCRDLARSLNTVAYMPLLIRTKAGIFDISDSISLKEIDEMTDLAKVVVPLNDVIDLPIIFLDELKSKKFCNGLRLTVDEKDGLYKVLDSEKNLLAIGKVTDNILGVEVYLND